MCRQHEGQGRETRQCMNMRVRASNTGQPVKLRIVALFQHRRAAHFDPGMRRERRPDHADIMIAGNAKAVEKREQGQGPRQAVTRCRPQRKEVFGDQERPFGPPDQLCRWFGWEDRLGKPRARFIGGGEGAPFQSVAGRQQRPPCAQGKACRVGCRYSIGPSHRWRRVDGQHSTSEAIRREIPQIGLYDGSRCAEAGGQVRDANVVIRLCRQYLEHGCRGLVEQQIGICPQVENHNDSVDLRGADCGCGI